MCPTEVECLIAVWLLRIVGGVVGLLLFIGLIGGLLIGPIGNEKRPL